jgi:hypothetical protein
MDQRLFLLLLLASSSCINIAVKATPARPLALAAYGNWLLACAALAMLLPRRRRDN